jgi:hypothetical protein
MTDKELTELFKLSDDIIKRMSEDYNNHRGLIEEAMQFFLLDGIGEKEKLKEIYDEVKRK